MEAESLFSKYEINGVLRSRGKAMERAIADYDASSLLNTAPEDLAAFMASKFELNVPELDLSGCTTDPPEEIKVDITHNPRRHFVDDERHYAPGTRVVLHVPFSGDSEFFLIQPNTFGFNTPRARILEDELQWAEEGESLNGPGVKAAFDRDMQVIETNLSYLRATVGPFNEQLSAGAQRLIDVRRKRLLDARNMTESLGFPLRRVDGSPSLMFPLHMKKIAIARPQPSAGEYESEPVLDSMIFEEILQVMSNMALVMEKSPSAFAAMEEENLRWHFLVQLNGIFEGQALGETFNYSGKTDILIGDKGRSLFIAECKFWGGPVVFNKALDQLLSYLCWRDTKAALVIFNRKKDFSAVLSQIPDLCSKHECYKRALHQSSESSFRFTFHSPADMNREIHLAVLAFDVPSTLKTVAKPSDC
jgi:hypothetical protein